MEDEILFRVILVGSAAVGKSCFLQRFSQDRFIEDYDLTIGVEFATRVMDVNGKDVKVQVWDTAGQENYRSITRSFYRRADAFLLMYDLTNVESFNSLESWLRDMRENSEPGRVVELVANQVDLESERAVSFKEGLEFKEKHGLFKFVEASAKTGVNVVEAFVELYKGYCQTMANDKVETKGRVYENPLILSSTTKLKRKKKCCK